MSDQTPVTTGFGLSGQLRGRDVIVRTVPEVDSRFRQSADFDRHILFRRIKVEGLLVKWSMLPGGYICGRTFAPPKYA
jgi:hypothetical protein